tara:strand:- start:13291 stop:15417 length:2127 start_codon:yes stop_codon:yes gene_type:complete
MSNRKKKWNERSYRRLLIDMHTPDWDKDFLAKYDPVKVCDASVEANVTGAMVYFQSHVGLCYWPTDSGRQHAAFSGRDLMAETLEQFKERKIPVCAYYSVNFNNWAYSEHPEWRLKLAANDSMGILPKERYGIVCLNNPDYRAFVYAQIDEIVKGYDIDAIFFDMVWWMGVCLCDCCRTSYRSETGCEIPQTVDWLDPVWCRFQTMRERWVTEFAAQMRDRVHQSRPDLQVYHNFALAMCNWTRGIHFDSAKSHDFLGGDFYGGREEQLVVSRLMLNLSESRPVEFMTTIAANLIEHDHHQNGENLQLMAYAATSCASAFLLIAAINPDGTVDRAMYDRMGAAFAGSAPYEPYLGGEPVEDIAVYFSSESKVNFVDNGTPVSDLTSSSSADYPHAQAVQGACRILQQAHLPFGVITAKQLKELDRYKVIVLPNILRITREEVEAFRGYVDQGGQLYASRYTSLTEVSGKRHLDFMLSDVFGCHYEGIEPGKIIYLKPTAESLESVIAPDAVISHRCLSNDNAGACRIEEQSEGTPLATLTLPYAYPSEGTIEGEDWAAIHSSPSWQHTERPTIIQNDFGKGRAIYSVADLESGVSEGHDKAFLALIHSLLGAKPSFEGETHPCVWMTVFDQVDKKQQIVSFLNYQSELPVIPIADVRFHLQAPEGHSFSRLLALPEETEIKCRVCKDGHLEAEIPRLDHFCMVAAEYV